MDGLSLRVPLDPLRAAPPSSLVGEVRRGHSWYRNPERELHPFPRDGQNLLRILSGRSRPRPWVACGIGAVYGHLCRPFLGGRDPCPGPTPGLAAAAPDQ